MVLFNKNKKPAKQKTLEERNADAEALCPQCGIRVDYRCHRCGATKTINQVSRNVIWMRNGRLVPGGSFKDERDAWVRVATEHNIPTEQWPERFRP